MQIKNTINKVINLNNDKMVTMVEINHSVRYIIDIEVSEKFHKNIRVSKLLIQKYFFSYYCEMNHN